MISNDDDYDDVDDDGNHSTSINYNKIMVEN